MTDKHEEKPFKVEEVDGVEAPPRARVEDAETAGEKLERKKDYLEGFLAQKPQTDNPTAPGGALYENVLDALRGMNDVRLFGPEDSAGIVSFVLEGIHPHDLGTILDEENVAIRAGHHCAQPLMERLGVPATARASFGLYSDEADVAALLRGIERTKRIFAQ